MRLSLQLAAGYFLIVGLAGWFVLEVFVEQVKPGVRDTMEDTLVDSANLIAELVAPVLSGREPGASSQIAGALARYRQRTVDAHIWRHSKRKLDLRIYVTDATGHVLYSTEPDQIGKDYSRWNDVYLTLSGQYGARSTRVDPNRDSSSVMHVAAPVMDQGRIIGVASVAKAGQSVAPIVETSKAEIRLRGFILLGITALIGAVFTWHLTRSIERLRRYARQVTAGTRAEPPTSRAAELDELAQALGEMRERLEGKQYVEHYLHTLTHELKSPLAAIRGAAELLSEPDMPQPERQRFLDNIRDQANRLAQVAERLLQLARVEQQQVLTQPEPIDPATLIAAAVDAASVAAMQRNIRFEVSGALKAHVMGDRFLLAQALANLIDNALGFSPEGGCIRIEARATEPAKGWPHPSRLDVCIADQGPGIPDFARERVFERFFSLARPSTGIKSTGLGLSFVREVAELHGGTIRLDNLAPTGVCATLTLPLAQI